MYVQKRVYIYINNMHMKIYVCMYTYIYTFRYVYMCVYMLVYMYMFYYHNMYLVAHPFSKWIPTPVCSNN